MATYRTFEMDPDDAKGADALRERSAVCPHCWQAFYADTACYIARHPDLIGDPVLGEMQATRLAPHEVTKDRDGHPVDPRGARVTERACPRCHLQVPPDLLRQRPMFVSIVGAPRSGKTYFVTAMIHELRRELSRFFQYALQDADSHDVRAFLQYESALFFPADPNAPMYLQKTQESGALYNNVRVGGADVVLPKPFIFSLRPTDDNVDRPKHGVKLNRDLVLYDNAGESFEQLRERYGEPVTQHLGEADTVLFAYDPLQDPAARERLAAVSADPQVGAAAYSYQQALILTEVIHRIRRHRGISGDARLPVDLAICVMKYDVWRPLLPWAAAAAGDGADPGTEDPIDHTSVEVDPHQPVGRLDVDEINRISLLVRAFLEDVNAAFVATAEANFRTVRYFPVSALGGSPELHPGAGAGSSGNPLLIRPSAIQPFRASHPLLWVIQRQGLIRKTHTDRATPVGLPRAELKQATAERLWLMTPAGQRLVVDAEYAGRWVIDPFTGQRIAIPGEPPPAPAKPAVDPAKPDLTTQAKATDIGLKMPDRRKGWFRK